MIISTEAFKEGEEIPSEYTCDGKDVSPALSFSEIPLAAKSLALIVDDPDSPVGVWNHWTIWNIPPKVSGLKSGEVPPSSREGVTSFSSIGYGGPCPGKGRHRYFFKLYALDEELSLPEGSTKEKLIEDMRGHIIAETELFGTYERKK